MTAWLLLALGGLSLWATVTATWRIRRPRRRSDSGSWPSAGSRGSTRCSTSPGRSWRPPCSSASAGSTERSGQIGLAAAAVSWVGLALCVVPSVGRSARDGHCAPRRVG